MEIAFIVVAVILIILGFVGIFVPVLPGSPLIFLGTLIYGIQNKFKDIGLKTYIILAILMILNLILDHFASIYGAKKIGSTKWGMLGSFLGGLIGLFLFSIIGLICGAIIGAVIFEFLASKNLTKALKSGVGVIFGFVLGIIFKTIIGLLMIGVFLWKIF